MAFKYEYTDIAANGLGIYGRLVSYWVKTQ